MLSNIVIKKALEIILLVELFSLRVVSHHESFSLYLNSPWYSGHVEMKNGTLKQLNITHHQICGYFCLLSIFARSTAALFWPEGVENLPYQTQQLLSKHNQLGWRMACSSASIPRGARTYNTNNNMKDIITEQSGILFILGILPLPLPLGRLFLIIPDTRSIWGHL